MKTTALIIIIAAYWQTLTRNLHTILPTVKPMQNALCVIKIKLIIAVDEGMQICNVCNGNDHEIDWYCVSKAINQRGFKVAKCLCAKIFAKDD